MRKIFLLAFMFALSGSVSTFVYAEEDVVDHSQHKDQWVCPMHPQVVSDKPGNCPICGMHLVKREKEEPAKPKETKKKINKEPEQEAKKKMPKGHVSFRLPLERVQLIGVKTIIVGKENISKKISTVGTVAFDPELYSAQNDLVEAIRNFENIKKSPLKEAIQSAKHMIDSARFRLEVMGISEDQIRKLEKNQKVDSSILVRDSGASAWIYAEIYESDLPDVKKGLPVEISAGFLKGKALNGVVSSVDRVIDPMTRSTKARILIEKASADMRPQNYVDVNISVPLGEQIVVPLDAVLNAGKEAWVFITDGNGYFEPRLITINSYVDSKVIINSGLDGGEQIVSSANFLIDSESRLRFVSESASFPDCPMGQSWDVGMSMCM